MKSAWSGQALSDEVGTIGPAPVQPGGPEILLGAYSPAGIRRLARWGNGFIAGGGNPQMAHGFLRQAEETWQTANRPGKPRLVGCAYYALGSNAAERGAAYILDYYSFIGPIAEQRARSIPATPEAVRAIIQSYKEIGADELILWPTIPELDQVSLLADLIAG